MNFDNIELPCYREANKVHLLPCYTLPPTRHRSFYRNVVSVENEGSFMIIITYAVKFVTKCNQAVLRDQTVVSRELFSVR